MSSDKPIVIIGAGMAGLTAAAYLTRAGKTVEIFEQHSLPGGYISSFTRKGFTFPSGPTGFGSNGIVFPILKELGLFERITFRPGGMQISWAGEDVPLTTPRETRDALAQRFPGEANSLRRYFRWVEVGTSAFSDMMKTGILFSKKPFVCVLKTMLKHPLMPWSMGIANRHTNRSLHDAYFQDALLKQMLNQLGYPVMNGQNTLGMWSGYFNDIFMPAGGLQVLADALAEDVREHGGTIHLKSKVTRILTSDGAATGVELADGRCVEAEAVITAADLHHTLYDLLGVETLTETGREKMERAVPSESGFTVYLGVEDHAELAQGLARFKNSHVWFTCADGRYMQIVLLSRDDPAAAPAGQHALYLAMLDPYDNWEGLKGDRTAYLERKAVLTEEIITRAEEFIPNLRKHIVVQDSASPLTYERYTGNWRGGTAGWNWDPAKSIRPDLATDVNIRNLYAVGHYVFSPGGVPTAMITAWYVAKAINESRD